MTAGALQTSGGMRTATTRKDGLLKHSPQFTLDLLPEFFSDMPGLPFAYLPGAAHDKCVDLVLSNVKRWMNIPGTELIAHHDDSTLAGLAVLCPLGWDSAIYGVPMARVAAFYVRSGTAEVKTREALVERLIETAHKKGYVHMDYQADLNDLKSAHAFCSNSFGIMATHLSIVWDLKRPVARPSGHVTVKEALPEDAECVGALAARAMPPFNRFSADPSLLHKAGEVFRQWGENTVRGYANKVHISLIEGAPVGYCAWKAVPDSEKMLGISILGLELTAVLQDARGRGALRHMVYEGLSWAREAGYRYAFVMTHALNTGMQRVCEGILGGKVLAARHSLHWHCRR